MLTKIFNNKFQSAHPNLFYLFTIFSIAIDRSSKQQYLLLRQNWKNFTSFFFFYIEFPSFQDILLQEKFATLIVNMSTDDPESKVRASALKCLQEMVQNSLLWSERLEEHEVPVSFYFTYFFFFLVSNTYI